jgi:type VI secretion system secreted protein VgrG
MDYQKAAQAVATLLSGGGGFETATRLHHIECDGPLSEGLVEAWCLREELNQPWRLELSVLSLKAGLDLQDMLALRLNLRSTLSDGSEFWRGGIVTEASADDADGGFARYRLVVEPWLGLLAHTRRSQVWQEK